MKKMDNILYIKLFSKYNELFSNAWNRRLESGSDSEAHNRQVANMQNEVYNDIQHWHEMPIAKEMPDMTADSVLAKIIDIRGAVELAEYAAVFCVDDMPDVVKFKLASFGMPICKAILEDVLARDWESRQISETDEQEADQDQIISASCMNLLGGWSYAAGFEPILEKFAGLTLPLERIAEEVRAYAIGLDPAPAGLIAGYLESSLMRISDLNPACEYLLITLTDIGKDHPDNQIFNCLKDCFRRMSNKAIGAICLGDYGDGRAIPALRGWLEKNPQIRDRQVHSEILSAIKRLGGVISDLSKPLCN
jgi:hypothetical protein